MEFCVDTIGQDASLQVQYKLTSDVNLHEEKKYQRSTIFMGSDVDSLSFLQTKLSSENNPLRAYLSFRARPTAENGLREHKDQYRYEPSTKNLSSMNYITLEFECSRSGQSFVDTMRKFPFFSPIVQRKAHNSVDALRRQESLVLRGHHYIEVEASRKGCRVNTAARQHCHLILTNGHGWPVINVVSADDGDTMHTFDQTAIEAVLFMQANLNSPDESHRYFISMKIHRNVSDCGWLPFEIKKLDELQLFVGCMRNDPWLSKRVFSQHDVSETVLRNSVHSFIEEEVRYREMKMLRSTVLLAKLSDFDEQSMKVKCFICGTVFPSIFDESELVAMMPCCGRWTCVTCYDNGVPMLHDGMVSSFSYCIASGVLLCFFC